MKKIVLEFYPVPEGSLRLVKYGNMTYSVEYWLDKIEVKSLEFDQEDVSRRVFTNIKDELIESIKKKYLELINQ